MSSPDLFEQDDNPDVILSASIKNTSNFWNDAANRGKCGYVQKMFNNISYEM